MSYISKEGRESAKLLYTNVNYVLYAHASYFNSEEDCKKFMRWRCDCLCESIENTKILINQGNHTEYTDASREFDFARSFFRERKDDPFFRDVFTFINKEYFSLQVIFS